MTEEDETHKLHFKLYYSAGTDLIYWSTAIDKQAKKSNCPPIKWFSLPSTLTKNNWLIIYLEPKPSFTQ